MRIRNQANSSTLFQFSDADSESGTGEAIVLNPESLLESFTFETELKERYGSKAIVKRQTGAKNKRLPFQLLIIGDTRDSVLSNLISTLIDNEFIYFDSESHQPRLDGVYAPFGIFTQKKNEEDNTITATFTLVEKES